MKGILGNQDVSSIKRGVSDSCNTVAIVQHFLVFVTAEVSRMDDYSLQTTCSVTFAVVVFILRIQVI